MIREAYIKKYNPPVEVQVDKYNTKTTPGFFESGFTEKVTFHEFSTVIKNHEQFPVAVIERESGELDWVALHNISFKMIVS